MKRCAAAILLIALILACRAEPKPKPVDVPGQKLYEIRGKIVSRSSGDNTIRLDHEAIPGFMEAMVMDYSVRGARVESLPPDGTRVQARLHAADDAYWLSDVRKRP